MAKLIFLPILIFLAGSLAAQKTERYSKAEKELIGTNKTQMMRVLKLSVPADSAVLKSVSKPIRPNNRYTRTLAERMLLSVQDPNNRGVGIAAPQVGISRRMIVVQRFDKEGRPFEVFLNPQILKASELMQLGAEGDLSFDKREKVMRHYSVEIGYQNPDGQYMTEMLEGFTSVIFQHERDHLDGILLTDRLTEQKNSEFVKASEESDLYYKK